MPTNNSNSVKPIMVSSYRSLKDLEAILEDGHIDPDDAISLCERLRKEVKRHKKTKRDSIAAFDTLRLELHEKSHEVVELQAKLTDAEELVTEHKQELLIERERLSLQDIEIADLKRELAALRGCLGL